MLEIGVDDRTKKNTVKFPVFAEPVPITPPTKKQIGTGCLVSLSKYD